MHSYSNSYINTAGIGWTIQGAVTLLRRGASRLHGARRAKLNTEQREDVGDTGTTFRGRLCVGGEGGETK